MGPFVLQMIGNTIKSVGVSASPFPLVFQPSTCVWFFTRMRRMMGISSSSLVLHLLGAGFVCFKPYYLMLGLFSCSVGLVVL